MVHFLIANCQLPIADCRLPILWLVCGHADYAVSTGSGSDRVSIHGTGEFARSITRSLPLPVLTSSLPLITGPWQWAMLTRPHSGKSCHASWLRRGRWGKHSPPWKPRHRLPPRPYATGRLEGPRPTHRDESRERRRRHTLLPA